MTSADAPADTLAAPPAAQQQAEFEGVASHGKPVEVDVSCVMPCLNEAETLAVCIDKAKRGIAELGMTGEVVVADNGSTDGSREIARGHGARVIEVARKGYGSALMAGIASARGRYIVMADADD